MQIPNINRYFLSIYVESVLKVFKPFDLLGVWSLDSEQVFFHKPTIAFENC